MKKLLLMKTVLLLCALIAGSGSVWADTEVTFTPGTDTGATSVTKSNVTCTMTTMNNSGYYQIYANQSGTFECSAGNITKIEFTCTASGTTKYGPGNASANVGSYSYSGSTGTWTGSATSVTISTTAQIRMSSLTITYAPASSDPSISASDVNLIPSATSGEISYTVTNSVAETHLTASVTSGEEWISNVAVNEGTKKVTFTTTANTSAKRVGTIHLVYGSDLATKDVTITQAGLYTVTYTTAQTGGTLVVKNGEDVVTTGDKLPVGTVLTITATPDGTHAFRNWQYNKGAGWQTKTANFDYTIDDNDVEFRANFDDAYPVNFSVNGQIASTARFADGKKITFPASITSFDGYEFAGWAASAIDGSVADKPTLVDTNNETMGTAEKTYYAVYVKNKYVATFNAADITATPLTGTRTWTHAGSNISLYINDGQHYTNGTPYTFTVKTGNEKYFQISAPTGYKLKKLTVTISESKYKINSVESGASVSTSSTTQTVTFSSDMNSVKCYAPTSGNQIRATNIVVEAIKAEGYCTTLTQSAVITAAKYATFYSISALDFTGTGITAYTATDNETSVTLNEITSGKVPAYTPVVLYNADADGTAINVPVIASATSVGDNDLRISSGKDVNNMYVLAKKPTIGFYPWNGTTDLSAGKVYLQAKASYGAREFLGFSEDVTAIESLKTQSAAKGEYFNLAGQRVAQPNKGLYIVNGKKVVNK
ncbi:MAG: BACON domain-containing protein [Prevotella sp.]|nr:BACON domain-containing protein [Prevotella sp.]